MNLVYKFFSLYILNEAQLFIYDFVWTAVISQQELMLGVIIQVKKRNCI